jgi:hypothetical protein
MKQILIITALLLGSISHYIRKKQKKKDSKDIGIAL